MKIKIFLMFVLLPGFAFSQDTLQVGNSYTIIDSLVINTCMTGFALTANYDTSVISISNIQKFGIFDVEIVNLFPEGRIEVGFNQLGSPAVCNQKAVLFSFEIIPKKPIANSGIEVISFQGVNGTANLNGVADSFYFYVIETVLDFINKLKIQK